MFRIKKGTIIYYRKFLKNNHVLAGQIIEFEQKSACTTGSAGMGDRICWMHSGASVLFGEIRRIKIPVPFFANKIAGIGSWYDYLHLPVFFMDSDP
jgi:hypothetical protein